MVGFLPGFGQEKIIWARELQIADCYLHALIPIGTFTLTGFYLCCLLLFRISQYSSLHPFFRTQQHRIIAERSPKLCHIAWTILWTEWARNDRSAWPHTNKPVFHQQRYMVKHFWEKPSPHDIILFFINERWKHGRCIRWEVLVSLNRRILN